MDLSPSRRVALFVFLLLAVTAGGIVLDELRHLDTPEKATVSFLNESDEGDVLGRLKVRVAASFRERYIGLSRTDSLGPNEGMLFVHDDAGRHAYVMRGMSFPIDIVFVAPNGTITRIYHADVDGSGAPYRGYAKWVVETPHRWTVRHGIDPGDELRIEWPEE